MKNVCAENKPHSCEFIYVVFVWVAAAQVVFSHHTNDSVLITVYIWTTINVKVSQIRFLSKVGEKCHQTISTNIMLTSLSIFVYRSVARVRARVHSHTNVVLECGPTWYYSIIIVWKSLCAIFLFPINHSPSTKMGISDRDNKTLCAEIQFDCRVLFVLCIFWQDEKLFFKVKNVENVEEKTLMSGNLYFFNPQN